MTALDSEAARRPPSKVIPRFESSYKFADLMRSLETLLRSRPNSISAGKRDPLTNISDLLAACRLPSDTPAYLARNGRECLYLALKSLCLKRHSRVGIPLFCCGCVFASIAAAGCIPVFLDIDLNTYGLDSDFLYRKRNEIDALIVVHTFGYPADLDLLQNCFGGRNVPFIEDCAHSLFSEYKGRTTGTHTEMSIFSFGLHKPAMAGGGGMLLINDPSLVKSADREFANLRKENIGRQMLHSINCWARDIAYRPASYGAFLASPLGRLFENRPVAAPEISKTWGAGVGWSPARIRIVDQMRVMGSVREFQRKIPALAQNAQKFQNAVRDSPLQIPRDPCNGKWNHFWIPVRFHNRKQRELARMYWRRRRVDAPPVWPLCVRDARRFGYEGGCQQAEQASQTVCRIPNYAWLSGPEIESISEPLRRSVLRA